MKYCDTCRSSYPADFSTCPRDQTALRVITDLPPGLILRGKYEILEKIGSGGMGAVYKARHTAFNELRAIKFVNTQLVADAEYLARFRSEAVVARRLQHPNAVRIEDLDGTEDGRPFIVMEYVDGRSLRKVLKEDGALPVERAVDITRQACAALEAAHSVGIVHRDIKPDNIVLVEKDGRDVVKVLDFGLAKILEGFEGGGGQVSTLTGMVVGTPQYMSPEQGMGNKAAPPDGRADLYALGVVLYEMLTGRLPFYSDSPVGLIIKHVQVIPVPPHELAPERGIPEDLSNVLMKTLAKDREDRYASAAHMAAALGAYDAPTAVSAVPTAGQEAPTAAVARPPADPGPTARKTLPGPTAATVVPPRPPTRPRPQQPTARLDKPTTVIAVEEPTSSGRGLLPWVLGAAALVVLAVVLTRPSSPPAASPVPSPVADTAAYPAPAAPVPAGQVGDDVILSEVQGLFFRSSGLRDAHLSAEVANGIVTLTGDVPNDATLRLAVALARSVRGVRGVFDHSVRVDAPAPQVAAGAPPATAPPETAAPAPAAPPPTVGGPEGDPPRVRELLEKARREIESDDPESAEETIQEVLRIIPDHPMARSILAKLKSRPPHPGGPRPRRQ